MFFSTDKSPSQQIKDFGLLATFLLKWFLVCVAIGLMAGSASALFLFLLQWAEVQRENNIWLIALLPVSGMVVGLLYYYWGKDVEGGNNLIIDQIHKPTRIINFKMAPFVLIGTVLTHLSGGSAGREGTAVQMSGSMADQLTAFFKFLPTDRIIILICGISAGFASVFGTPIAGAIFGLEVCVIGKIKYEALVPAFFSAIIANYITTLWGAHHTHYEVPELLLMDSHNFIYAIIAGILFGLCSRLFSFLLQFTSRLFIFIKYPPLRPFAGGLIIAAMVYLIGDTKFIGLGIPVIEQSFTEPLEPYYFLLKVIFTVITLGAGFKGGEVTPLFFIGATLGNALHLFIPMPLPLLTAMGFVAVFAGASNTPIACMLMGFELFGMQTGVFIAIACVVSYFFSGHSGIYHAQKIGQRKFLYFGKQNQSKKQKSSPANPTIIKNL